MSAAPDSARPLVHAATGLCALLLAVLPPPWHWVAAGVGVALGWIVFPLTGLDRVLRRPGEAWLGGLRTYPLAVAALVVFLPRCTAAAAWGVLAFGDAAAAWVGQRVSAPAIFGHPKATWSGSAAYVFVGALAAWGLSQGLAALHGGTAAFDVGPLPTWGGVFAAAGAAALADLVPIPPDDNMPAAAAAGAVLALLTP